MRLYEIESNPKPKVGRALQHAEDLVIIDGSAGALRALGQLAALANDSSDITIKWDGSPAIYFGRNESGKFVLTDKSGFQAKGYDGKVTRADELERMLLSRGKEVDDSRKRFAASMASLWDMFEEIVDPSFRGYIFGDLLYTNPPSKDRNGDYTFTPNTVTYHIPEETELGKRIAPTMAGIVVHHFLSLDGKESPIRGPIKGIDTDKKVLVVGPTSVTGIPKVNTTAISTAQKFVSTNAQIIDALLDDTKLAENKLSDFKAILYKFVNQQVHTRDLSNLNKKFDRWLSSSSISDPKKIKIATLRKEQSTAFSAIFTALEMIMKIKDDVIDQLDTVSPIRSSIAGQPGGEGYVKGDIKLVPRTKFTAANIEKYA